MVSAPIHCRGSIQCWAVIYDLPQLRGTSKLSVFVLGLSVLMQSSRVLVGACDCMGSLLVL